MKKELRERIKDPSIFENEYFKVVYPNVRTVYVKCDKLSLCKYLCAQTLLIEGYTIVFEYNGDMQIFEYTISPQKEVIHINNDDLETDIQFISQEEFDKVKQQVIDILS